MKQANRDRRSPGLLGIQLDDRNAENQKTQERDWLTECIHTHLTFRLHQRVPRSRGSCVELIQLIVSFFFRRLRPRA
jgi:hypothetical protein